jgi:hypothetical protein
MVLALAAITSPREPGLQTTVSVGWHTNPDTFAFAFGTNGKYFTTVTGAAAGDRVVVNGGQLGNTLVQGPTAAASLGAFITSLGTLTKGDTYVGWDATDSFVVTDAQSGKTGAIEVVGVFTHSTLANHVLTLQV